MSTFLATWRADLRAGFTVFLLALPLSLGISIASQFPPLAGLITAIVGGIVAGLVGPSRYTIKGPAAGMIAVVAAAVLDLGYRQTLAVVCVAAVFQIGLALLRAGRLTRYVPHAVTHGMMAAIGLIIISKQLHIMLGVPVTASSPLRLFAAIPTSLANLNPEIALLGGLAFLLVACWPKLNLRFTRPVPAPLVVLALAIPLTMLFDIPHAHSYEFLGERFYVGPNHLLRIPAEFIQSLSFPDFGAVGRFTFWPHVLTFLAVGSIESSLTVQAIEGSGPKAQAPLNADLFAVGVGNLLAGLVGGLPMISEVVRSKANVDAGAKSRFANVFHGFFLLLAVLLIPRLLQLIPLSALAGLLVFTGLRLASPVGLWKNLRAPAHEALPFYATLILTLATDLLLGVLAGLVVFFALRAHRNRKAKETGHAL